MIHSHNHLMTGNSSNEQSLILPSLIWPEEGTVTWGKKMTAREELVLLAGGGRNVKERVKERQDRSFFVDEKEAGVAGKSRSRRLDPISRSKEVATLQCLLRTPAKKERGGRRPKSLRRGGDGEEARPGLRWSEKEEEEEVVRLALAQGRRREKKEGKEKKEKEKGKEKKRKKILGLLDHSGSIRTGLV
ncbi:hypothetical protein JCGZ_19417 [Jatropha curcas]|uniref:Uncharacterized protein n=1 Tax=Jatropha curcas TaxID=180498 RepID=A0A067L7L3_JATCU|nr:hypothetical protein JCGZ_19417 [Jatropha curcas]